jgi:hypothetical protein
MGFTGVSAAGSVAENNQIRLIAAVALVWLTANCTGD